VSGVLDVAGLTGLRRLPLGAVFYVIGWFSDDARAVLVGGVVAELSVAETAPMRHRARTVP